MPTSAWKQHSGLKGSLLSHPQQEPSGQGRAFQVCFPPSPLLPPPKEHAPTLAGPNTLFCDLVFPPGLPPFSNDIPILSPLPGPTHSWETS